jgi:hypothetical protein
VEPVRVVETEVYADHSQFYVVDAGSDPGWESMWDGKGLERRLHVGRGIVAVATVGHCDVPIRLEVWEQEPPLALAESDHVVDGSLELGSGRLGLAEVGGPAGGEPIDVEAGSYRLRASWAGLDGADEMDGGDRYLIQIWRAPAMEPEVRKWWPPWDPAGVRPQPTTARGCLLVGAEAEDARVQMSWLASGDGRHLFRGAGGALWEHSNLPHGSGTPQLEELTEEEALERYGPSDTWGTIPYVRPRARHMVRDLWNAWRVSRGRGSS